VPAFWASQTGRRCVGRRQRPTIRRPPAGNKRLSGWVQPNGARARNRGTPKSLPCEFAGVARTQLQARTSFTSAMIARWSPVRTSAPLSRASRAFEHLSDAPARNEPPPPMFGSNAVDEEVLVLALITLEAGPCRRTARSEETRS
jgi:hypothetical protein